MKTIRLAVGMTLAAVTAACGSSDDSATIAGEGTSTLQLTGIVDPVAFGLENAMAVASDELTYSTSLREDGSFQIDLPAGHAYEVIIATTTPDGELRAIGHVVNPTQRVSGSALAEIRTPRVMSSA